MNSIQLLEPDIKAMILNHLKHRGDLHKNVSIINEFTIDNYSRRVDLAIVDENNLIAIEIKSEADSLCRLSGQVETYLEYFDKVIVVAASKHMKKIMKTVPKNVAVWEILNNQLKVKKRGKIVRTNNKNKIIRLMTASELLKLANKLSLPFESSNRNSLEKILEQLSVSTLRESALRCIKKRFHITSSAFLKNICVNEAKPKDLELLSPYKKERLAAKVIREKREATWNSWAATLFEDPHLIAMSEKTKEPIFGNIPRDIQLLVTA